MDVVRVAEDNQRGLLVGRRYFSADSRVSRMLAEGGSSEGKVRTSNEHTR